MRGAGCGARGAGCGVRCGVPGAPCRVRGTGCRRVQATGAIGRRARHGARHGVCGAPRHAVWAGGLREQVRPAHLHPAEPPPLILAPVARAPGALHAPRVALRPQRVHVRLVRAHAALLASRPRRRHPLRRRRLLVGAAARVRLRGVGAVHAGRGQRRRGEVVVRREALLPLQGALHGALYTVHCIVHHIVYCTARPSCHKRWGGRCGCGRVG